MGIYYGAVDHDSKEYFESPEGFSIKFPGICAPLNPFANMVIMKNATGHDFRIENDGDWDCYYSKGYKNITEKVYQEYLELFPQAKEHYEKGE